MKTVNANSFEADVLNSAKPTVVDFGADWCQPCKSLKPTLEAFAKDREDVNVVFVDVDEADKIVSEFGIRSVPTIALFKGGKLVNRIVGNAARKTLDDFVDTNLVA